MINSVVPKYLGFDFEIGRNFWEFISDDPHCYRKIWALISLVAEEYKHKNGTNLKTLIAQKKVELTKEFKDVYGNDEREIWDNLLEINM